MQALGRLVTEDFHRPQADEQVPTDLGAVEFRGHAGEFEFAVQRLVGDAQERSIGDAKAEAVGGDRGAFHVEADGPRLAEPLVISRWSRSSQLRLSMVATVPVRMMRLISMPSSSVTSATALSSATWTSARAGMGTVSGRSASSTLSSRT